MQVVVMESMALTAIVSANATMGAPAMWKQGRVSAATASWAQPAARGVQRIATARTAQGCACVRMAHAATSALGSASVPQATLGSFARTVSVPQVSVSCTPLCEKAGSLVPCNKFDVRLQM